MTDLIERQFHLLYEGLRPVLEQAARNGQSMDSVQLALKHCADAYTELMKEIRQAQQGG